MLELGPELGLVLGQVLGGVQQLGRSRRITKDAAYPVRAYDRGGVPVAMCRG